MKDRLVFIGGVHGAGKSAFALKLANHFGAQHVTASELIRQQVALSHDKSVGNVQSNQNVLVEALRRLDRISNTLILDGHFCLLTKDRQIENVPLDTFKRITPSGIVVVSNAPVVIQERLRLRDGSAPAEYFISRFQSKEIEWARSVSTSLGVPAVHLLAPSDNAMHNPELVAMFED